MYKRVLMCYHIWTPCTSLVTYFRFRRGPADLFPVYFLLKPFGARMKPQQTNRKKYNVRDVFKLQKTASGSSEHCCVPLCSASSRYNSEISFHRFPKDSGLRAQWLQRIRRTGFVAVIHLRSNLGF